ncbi:L,D-transpeptidase family protein [Clostridium sp. D2Q-11]|uniref:L,D-transpeptidase family protein n=1 Tax=Anaeromonas frigoriresistens TaxID=2683708 RepID=A0A942UYY6_9FIRM|nr:L,D-transpeptidase family protein [Anaeromonas frigoriresistens]MBS4538167.1 L,D-transpeptidase family protein [Anaeromonas frigoriresistens]
MFKGGYNIILAIFCLLTVIIVGNKITYIIGLKFIGDYQVYHQYEEWERKQLRDNPDYDNLWILINIDSKQLKVIDLDTKEIIKKYTVATGKDDTPTPIGDFKIVQKAQWGGSFGSRWMKLNVPWGNYGIHGTNKPNSIGRSASHGCVRMRNKDIEDLYSIVKYNTPVTIEGGPHGAFNYGFRVLNPGDKGADVQEVQKRLKIKDYYNGNIDGVYGEAMKSAVINFKKKNELALNHSIDYEMYEKLGITLME